jgi:hypothetical protein
MSDVSIIISTNANEASKEIGGLSASIMKSAAKANQMAKAFDFLDKSFNRGKIDAAQYSSAIVKLNKEEARLYSVLGKTTGAVNRQSVALNNSAATASKASLAAGILAGKQRMAGKSTNKFGMYSQQVGYQVGDFAVQVQSGTNALVAFGQQGTQLAGLLPGLAGAVLGIGLAIGTAVARSVLDAKKLEIDFKAVIKELKKPLETIRPILDLISGAFKSTGGAAVSVLSTIANNLDRVVLYITVAGAAFGTKLVVGLVAAKLATFSLAGAFTFLRTAVIRSGIGALLVGVAEAIRMFFLLKEQLGGVGPLLDLLKKAFVEVTDKIGLAFMLLVLKISSYFLEIKLSAVDALKEVLRSVNDDFVNNFVGAFVGAMRAIGVLIATIPEMFVAVFKSVKLAVANGVNDFTGTIGKGINGLRTLLKMEALDFGDLINTDSMDSGNVSGKAAEIMKEVKEVYALATSIDYVGAAQNKLGSASTKIVEDLVKVWSQTDAVQDSLETQGTAIGKLSAAYDALGKSSEIDFGSMLKVKVDDDKDKSKAEDPIAKLKREIKLNKEIVNMSKEKATVLTQVRDIQKQLADEGRTFDTSKLIALVKYNEELKKQRDRSQALSEHIASTMETGFMKMIDGTTSVKDAFKSMASEIIKELYRVLVVQQMVNAAKGFFGFKDGGAFSGGSQIEAYADGGVVGSPTTFPMAGGKTGLMGEAGPEAIMPLKRGSNGKLGVQMEGGGGDVININQSFNFQANGDDSVKKLIAQAAPKIADMAKASVIDSRRRGGSTKAAFG